jgi:GH24 family phage-related lysozyme (muramidase)
VLKLNKVLLTDSQFDALVSLTLNLGSSMLQFSMQHQKINKEE